MEPNKPAKKTNPAVTIIVIIVVIVLALALADVLGGYVVP